MKPIQPSMILSSAALLLSLLAILLQFVPIEAFTPGGFQAAPAEGVAAMDGSAKTVQVASEQAKPSAAKTVDPAASDPATNEQVQRIAMLERQVAQLAQVIRSSGLDAAASVLSGVPGGTEPLLATIGEKYATRARFEESRKQMLERSAEMRRRDLDSYGAENYQRISELSEKARPKRGNETEAERSEREAALTSLLTNYPESWSTSVAVAEQALSAAMERDTQGAEMYYESLIGTSPYSEVVTEQGIDAIPTLQTYLARQYAAEGRYEDASAILDALSAHSNSTIVEPNETGEPTTKSVQEIVTDLREKIAR